MTRSTPRTAGAPPKLLCRLVMVTAAIQGPWPLSRASAAHGAERQSAHEMALHKHAERDRGYQGDDGKRARLAVKRTLEACEGAKHGGQRECGLAGEQQGEKELRPTRDEGEYGRRDHSRRRQRHRDAPEGSPSRAAIDHCRVFERPRQLPEIGKHHPDRDWKSEYRIGEDQAEVSIVQV